MNKKGVHHFFIMITRIYDPKIVIGLLILLGAILANPLPPFLYDYFDFASLKSTRDFIMDVLKMTLGFSSLILTALTLAYGFYSKSIKRNVFSLILESNGIRIIFSLFSGIILFLGLGFFLCVKFPLKNQIALEYFSFGITITFILIQIPLFIVLLSETTSLKKVEHLVNKIFDSHIESIANRQFKGENALEFADSVESNPLIMLKDLAIGAVKDGDRILPQTTLNLTFERLISSIRPDTPNNVIKRNIEAWSMIVYRLIPVIIKNGDLVSVQVILALCFRAHNILKENNFLDFRDTSIDKIVAELNRQIIKSDDFFEIQSYMLNDNIDYLKLHITSISYSDIQLPTREYHFNDTTNEYLEGEKCLMQYWFYITHGLLDLYFGIIIQAIEGKNKEVYSTFHWQFQSIFSLISNAKNLTHYQGDTLFEELYYKAANTSYLAINNGIYENVEIVASYQIAAFLKEERKIGFTLLYYWGDVLQRLAKRNALSSLPIDQFFMIGRQIAKEKMLQKSKIETFDYILDVGLGLFAKEEDIDVKHWLVYQLRWLSRYLETEADLEIIKERYGIRIQTELNGFGKSKYDILRIQ
jgi:hypothetical protein